MIKKLYPGYFQKSKVFLYPLLSISKKHPIQPLNTYLSWNGVYDIDDCRLLITYDISKPSREWNEYVKLILVNNVCFERIEVTKDKKRAICTMNMRKYKEDYTYVIQGKYSKLSPFAKALIQSFYGFQTAEWQYMETYLLPKRHFLTYAELLNVEVEQLEDIGELASLPDFQKEQLSLSKNKFVSSTS